MKKISKLKLNLLSDANLRDREMNGLKGGNTVCYCSCYFSSQPGGASSADNMNTNHASGYHSPQGCAQYAVDDSGFDIECTDCNALNPGWKADNPYLPHIYSA